MSTVSIPPYYYVHVLDLNTNVRKLILGPRTYNCQENEKLVLGPEKMVSLTPSEYCIVANPVKRMEGLVQFDENGQVQLSMSDKEYRFHQEPFPLYPGEVLFGSVEKLTVVAANNALRLRALCNLVDTGGTERQAGDEWLFEGPNTYYPRVEENVVDTQQAIMIEQNTAIRIRAKRDCIDRGGIRRTCGDQWLVDKVGNYMLTVNEELLSTESAQVLNEQNAVHVRAINAHTDRFGRTRQSGDEWLVTNKDADSYICDVDQRLIRVVKAITLEWNQFCVIVNPVNELGQPQLGHRRLVRGECSFFLLPGEWLQYGIENAYTLGPNDGLVLMASERVEESDPLGHKANPIIRNPGDKWLICGPCEYIPPVGIEVIEQRSAIPLGDSEGIYVRNRITGEIRSVIGSTYMLTEEEEHWEKWLPKIVRKMLYADKVPLIGRQHFNQLFNVQAAERSRPRRKARKAEETSSDEESSDSSSDNSIGQKEKCLLMEDQDSTDACFEESYFACADLCEPDTDRNVLTRPDIPIEPEPFPVVSLQVPHNAAVQVVDFRSTHSRVEFGPTLVMLEPHEQFTLLSLSGGKPKRPHAIKSLYLLLGPDSLTDVVVVETADHARISIQVSYNWLFETELAMQDTSEAAKLFSVLDFVGDTCKTMASRIRGAVASIAFDDFHKNSARIIRAACLGMDGNGKINNYTTFPDNRLRITTVDIQSVSPEDQRTNELLQQTVQMAIEITTNSQEAAARHEAAKVEQEARGRLERQKIKDEAEIEVSNKTLVEKQIEATCLQATGEANAAALGIAESARIASLSTVTKAKAMVEENRITMEAELEEMEKLRQIELSQEAAKNKLRLAQQRARAELEASTFTSMVQSIGRQTLGLMSNAGSKHEVQMLQALGLRSTLITDGSTPINLLTTAGGLIGHSSSEPVGSEQLIRQSQTIV